MMREIYLYIYTHIHMDVTEDWEIQSILQTHTHTSHTYIHTCMHGGSCRINRANRVLDIVTCSCSIPQDQMNLDKSLISGQTEMMMNSRETPHLHIMIHQGNPRNTNLVLYNLMIRLQHCSICPDM